MFHHDINIPCCSKRIWLLSRKGMTHFRYLSSLYSATASFHFLFTKDKKVNWRTVRRTWKFGNETRRKAKTFRMSRETLSLFSVVDSQAKEQLLLILLPDRLTFKWLPDLQCLLQAKTCSRWLTRCECSGGLEWWQKSNHLEPTNQPPTNKNAIYFWLLNMKVLADSGKTPLQHVGQAPQSHWCWYSGRVRRIDCGLIHFPS